MFSTAKKILIHISLLNFLNFFLTRVKEECIYALCVGLEEDNTIPTIPPIYTRKTISYKTTSLE